MNIHNKAWNRLLTISLICISLNKLTINSGKLLFLLVPLFLLFLFLCSMIKMFSDDTDLLLKRNVEMDGVYKLVKLFLMISILESSSVYLYIFIACALLVIFLDARNRNKIYRSYQKQMRIDLYQIETEQEAKLKKSYKYVWLMMFGLVLTCLLRGEAAETILILLACIFGYEGLLSYNLYLEFVSLGVKKKKRIECFLVFYGVAVVISILNIWGYDGALLYLIMGGAHVPTLNELSKRKKAA